MEKTYWFDALVLEPPLDALPGGLRMYLEVKRPREVKTPDGGIRLCTGLECAGAAEFEENVECLKDELAAVVAEAKRRGKAYHAKLKQHRKL